MKPCESYLDLIMRSIDRETSPQEEQQLQTHLSQCEACRTLFETYRAIAVGLAASEEDTPDTLTGAVMNSIHAEQEQRSPKHLLKRFRFTAVAAVAAVLILVFARFQPSVTSDSNSVAKTTRTAEATVPQVEAQFQAATDITDGQETAMAMLEEAPAEEAAEEAADADLSQQVDALHKLGLSGTLYLISGVSAEELTALLPEIIATELATGETVYETSLDAVNQAVANGDFSIVASFEDDGETCYLILTD